MIEPLTFLWRDGAMWPVTKFVELARRQFKSAHVYVLEGYEPISHAERAYYHMQVKKAHDNLDAAALELYPNPNTLRKWALIVTHWRVANVCFGPSEDWAINTLVANKRTDDFSITVTKPPQQRGDQWMVAFYMARTQKVGDQEKGFMTPEEWRQSKEDVLAILANRIGVTQKTLEKEGRR